MWSVLRTFERGGMPNVINVVAPLGLLNSYNPCQKSRTISESKKNNLGHIKM